MRVPYPKNESLAQMQGHPGKSHRAISSSPTSHVSTNKKRIFFAATRSLIMNDSLCGDVAVGSRLGTWTHRRVCSPPDCALLHVLFAPYLRIQVNEYLLDLVLNTWMNYQYNMCVSARVRKIGIVLAISHVSPRSPPHPICRFQCLTLPTFIKHHINILNHLIMWYKYKNLDSPRRFCSAADNCISLDTVIPCWVLDIIN